MAGFPGVAPPRCVLSFGRQAQDATPGPLCTRRTVISSLCMAGFAGYVTFALCSLLLSAGRVVHSLDKLFSPVVVQRQVPVLVRTVLSVARGDSTGAVLGRVYGHVNRWITDSEVDSRLSGHVFLPLISDSHLLFSSPEEYMIWIFWEMTSGIIHVFSTLWFDSGYMLGVSLRGFLEAFHTISRGFSVGDDFRFVSVFSAELGSTADTCAASVYEAFWKRGFSLGNDFMFVSVFSAELGSSARQRKHAVRKSTELFEEALIFSGFRLQ